MIKKLKKNFFLKKNFENFSKSQIWSLKRPLIDPKTQNYTVILKCETNITFVLVRKDFLQKISLTESKSLEL